MEKILILAPHTDDGEIGCGATIAKFVKQKKEIFYVAFSIAEESVPEKFPKNILEAEVKLATKVLGIKPENLFIKKYKVRHFPHFRQDILEELVILDKEITPDLVFMPSSFDIHQDHKTVYEEGIRAFKKRSILGYEFMWNNFSFGSTLSSVVSNADIELKIEALSKYKSQTKKLYGTETLIRGLANFRGIQISEEYAEAFEVIRWIIR